MINAEELREKIANTIVVTRDGTHVGSVGSYVGTLVMDAIMRTAVEELAEVKEQKLIPQEMHRLKMAAKKAWFEFNGSEGPDWSNPVHPQWLIHCYRRSGEIFAVKGTPQIQTGMPSFPTERSCRAYIDNNPEGLKLLFGVE